MPLFRPTPISGLTIVEPHLHTDERGYFMETYHAEKYDNGSISARFVQDNQSLSAKGVLRGLHFNIGHPQAKLVRVLRGSAYDVTVDLRQDSPTFGEWYGIILSAENKLQVYIPEGFAHGFLALEDDTELLYKCSAYYDKDGEAGIYYNDTDLAIDWATYMSKDAFIISDKDKIHPSFRAFQNNNPF